MPGDRDNKAPVACIGCPLDGSRQLCGTGDVRQFPAVDDLPDIATMPDPFRKPDGRRITSPVEWKLQRLQLRAMMEHYLYGRVPPKPSADKLSSELVSDKPWTSPDGRASGRKQRHGITLYDDTSRINCGQTAQQFPEGGKHRGAAGFTTADGFPFHPARSRLPPQQPLLPFQLTRSACGPPRTNMTQPDLLDIARKGRPGRPRNTRSSDA